MEQGGKVRRKNEGAGVFFKAAAVASLLKHVPREQPDRFGFHLLFTSDESSYCHCPEDSQWKRNARSGQGITGINSMLIERHCWRLFKSEWRLQVPLS